jgi:hypothetical protein
LGRATQGGHASCDAFLQQKPRVFEQPIRLRHHVTQPVVVQINQPCQDSVAGCVYGRLTWARGQAWFQGGDRVVLNTQVALKLDSIIV